ncbi:MAG: hypothetical protein RL754_1151 [Bacteroidota bacterium]|jgi:hypothetical protein
MPATATHSRSRRHAASRPKTKEERMSKSQLYAQIGLVIAIIGAITAMAFFAV